MPDGLTSWSGGLRGTRFWDPIATLAYLAAVSGTRGKKNLPELCAVWERKLRRQVSALRKAAIELGSSPDDAIEPLDPRPVGRAAHSTAVATGAAGEAVDKAVAAVKEKTGFFDQSNANGESDPVPEGAAAGEESKKRKGLFRRG